MDLPIFSSNNSFPSRIGDPQQLSNMIRLFNFNSHTFIILDPSMRYLVRFPTISAGTTKSSNIASWTEVRVLLRGRWAAEPLLGGLTILLVAMKITSYKKWMSGIAKKSYYPDGFLHEYSEKSNNDKKNIGLLNTEHVSHVSHCKQTGIHLIKHHFRIKSHQLIHY